MNQALLASLVVSMVALPAAALGLPSVSPPVSDLCKNAAQVPHAPIQILGDEGFTVENGVIGGQGTENDPYRICGWNISSGLRGIELVRTTKHVLIMNNWIHDLHVAARAYTTMEWGVLDTNRPAGIAIHQASNVIIASNVIERIDPCRPQTVSLPDEVPDCAVVTLPCDDSNDPCLDAKGALPAGILVDAMAFRGSFAGVGTDARAGEWLIGVDLVVRDNDVRNIGGSAIVAIANGTVVVEGNRVSRALMADIVLGHDVEFRGNDGRVAIVQTAQSMLVEGNRYTTIEAKDFGDAQTHIRNNHVGDILVLQSMTNVVAERNDVQAVWAISPGDVTLRENNIARWAFAEGGPVDANDNWWGCPAGPNTPGCALASGPFLVETWSSTPYDIP